MRVHLLSWRMRWPCSGNCVGSEQRPKIKWHTRDQRSARKQKNSQRIEHSAAITIQPEILKLSINSNCEWRQFILLIFHFFVNFFCLVQVVTAILLCFPYNLSQFIYFFYFWLYCGLDAVYVVCARVLCVLCVYNFVCWPFNCSRLHSSK